MAVENIADRGSNNYNLVRLVLAWIVAVGHGALILELPIYYDLFKIPAVGIFFFISGIFVSLSLENSASVKLFVLKRIARIYPAAWFTILCAVFLFGLLSSTCSFLNLISSRETWHYLLDNALLFKMEFYHSCLFAKSPLTHQVNASLWSLQYEVIAYTGLLFLGVVGFIKYPKWILAGIVGLLIVGTLVQFDIIDLALSNFVFVGIVMSTFFLFGVYAYFAKFIIKLNWSLFLTSILVLIVLNFIPELHVFTIPFYCYLALFIGSKLKLPKWNWIKNNDISYGVYLLHFPIFQFFQSLPWSSIAAFSVALIVTFLLALFSWKLIEQPSMRWIRAKI